MTFARAQWPRSLKLASTREPTSKGPSGMGGRRSGSLGSRASKGGLGPPNQSPGGASKGGRAPGGGGPSKGGRRSSKGGLSKGGMRSGGGPSKGGRPKGGSIGRSKGGRWPSYQPGGGLSKGGRSKGGRCGSKPLPPIGPSKGGRCSSKGGLPKGGGGRKSKGGGPRGSKGGWPKGGNSKGGRSSGGRAGTSSPPWAMGMVTQRCRETGRSAVQSMGSAATGWPAWPSRLASGQRDTIWRLNFSSTTGAFGGVIRSSNFAVHHSIRFKWQSFCILSVGLPAMSSGSGLPGT
mmetsp:Transcript_20777/g.65563  ORF Transcript_20777/g.65563 Transcript_20777/m.65563 type:complete len:291 (+) Transcript_20777:414-1286(+)